MKTLESVTFIIKNSNWLCKNKTIISVFKTIVRNCNLANTKFVDKKGGKKLHFPNGYDSLCVNKCIFPTKCL